MSLIAKAGLPDPRLQRALHVHGAHSDGTDKNGCHQEKATGTRHCH
ncbi:MULTISPECIES: YHYH domain-containing protein [unclassified Variovorax]